MYLKKTSRFVICAAVICLQTTVFGISLGSIGNAFRTFGNGVKGAFTSGVNNTTRYVPRTGIPFNPLGGFSSPTSIAFSPFGDRHYVTNNNSNTVNVVRVTNNNFNITNNIDLNYPGARAVVSPDGTRVVVTHPSQGVVSVINGLTNTSLGELPVGTNPTHIAFDPSSMYAYTANRGNGTISAVEPLCFTSVPTHVSSIPNIRQIGIRPGNARFGLATSSDGFLHPFNLVSGVAAVGNGIVDLLRGRSPNLGSGLWGLAFHPFGNRNAFYTTNNTTGVVNRITIVNNNYNITNSITLDPGITDVVPSPDGTTVVVVNPDTDKIHMLDADDLTPIEDISASNPTGFAFVPQTDQKLTEALLNNGSVTNLKKIRQ